MRQDHENAEGRRPCAGLGTTYFVGDVAETVGWWFPHFDRMALTRPWRQDGVLVKEKKWSILTGAMRSLPIEVNLRMDISCCCKPDEGS